MKQDDFRETILFDMGGINIDKRPELEKGKEGTPVDANSHRNEHYGTHN